MKINKILLLSLSLSSLLWLSCGVFTGSNFEGSEPVKYEHDLLDDEKAVYLDNKSITKDEITISTGNLGVDDIAYIAQASSTTYITVIVDGNTLADSQTFLNAFKFYTLQDNSVNSAYYPIRSSQALPSRILSVVAEGNKVTAVLIVDTSTVNSYYIAALVDAAALKDKSGYPMLNNDDNKVPGETSDNFLYYIRVEEDADGDSLSGTMSWSPVAPNYKESFYPPLVASLAKLYDNDHWTLSYSLDYVEVETPIASYTATGNVPAGYHSGYTDAFNHAICIEYLEPGASAWQKDTAFVFAYTDINTYKAKSSTFKPGTKWRFKQTPTQVKDELLSPVLYGHSAVRTTVEEIESFEIPSASQFNYFTESPDYIVNSKGATFTAGSITKAGIQTAQRSFFTVTSKGNGKYLIKLDDSYEFAAFADFIVTDTNKTKLNASVTQKDDDKNVIVLQLDNKFYSGTIGIWVGNGVTLTQNSYNASQTKFGAYKWTEDKDASGYVCIYGSL